MATSQTAVTPEPEPQLGSEPMFFYNWLCPYVHRVNLTLGHKKATIQRTHVDLVNKPSWYTKYSPLGKVPAVTYPEGGEPQVLYESLVLQQWVNEFYQGPDLQPGTPAERAKARIIVSRYDGSVVSGFYGALRAPSKEEFKAVWDKIQAELTWLEQNIHPTGPFLTGSQPTLVDAWVAPWLLRAFLFKHFRKVDLLKGHPRLAAFVEAYTALPEVQATFKHPQHGVNHELWMQAMNEMYSKFAGEPKDYSDAVV